MCNLYSITTNQEAIRALFRKVNRYVGNLAPMPWGLTRSAEHGYSLFFSRGDIAGDLPQQGARVY